MEYFRWKTLPSCKYNMFKKFRISLSTGWKLTAVVRIENRLKVSGIIVRKRKPMKTILNSVLNRILNERRIEKKNAKNIRKSPVKKLTILDV